MKLYKNRNFYSSVYSYDYGDDWIRIEFVTDEIRTYTYEISGIKTVRTLIKFARKGYGLSSYLYKSKPNYLSQATNQNVVKVESRINNVS